MQLTSFIFCLNHHTKPGYMLKKLCLILFIFSSFSVFSQNKKAGNKLPGRSSFYTELGGPGILFSANIDTRFKESLHGWGGRVGLGFVTAYEETVISGNYNYDLYSVVTIPAQINYIFGKDDSPHAFEVGAGLTFLGRKLEILNFDKTQLFGTAAFMYRRQPLKGGFTWRIGFTPLIAKGFIQALGGLGVGYSF